MSSPVNTNNTADQLQDQGEVVDPAVSPVLQTHRTEDIAAGEYWTDDKQGQEVALGASASGSKLYPSSSQQFHEYEQSLNQAIAMGYYPAIPGYGWAEYGTPHDIMQMHLQQAALYGSVASNDLLTSSSTGADGRKRRKGRGPNGADGQKEPESDAKHDPTPRSALDEWMAENEDQTINDAIYNYKEMLEYIPACEETQTPEAFFCHMSDCSFKCPTGQQLADHVKTMFNCPECPKIFHTQSQMKKHADWHLKSDNTEDHLCEFCGVHVKTQKSLFNHQRIMHGYCATCQVTFPKNSALIAHIRANHTGENLFDCNQCDGAFFSKSRLITHQSQMHGSKTNFGQCPYCEKELNMASMRVHIQRLHEKKKNFKCQHCSYESYDTYMMKEHMRRHLGEYIYKCEYCSFQAVKKYQLDSHIRRHTGEKPFTCHLCNYASAWNVQLKQHIKIHEQPLSEVLTCHACNIAFKDGRALRSHNRHQHADFARAIYPPPRKSMQQEMDGSASQSQDVVGAQYSGFEPAGPSGHANPGYLASFQFMNNAGGNGVENSQPPENESNNAAVNESMVIQEQNQDHNSEAAVAAAYAAAANGGFSGPNFPTGNGAYDVELANMLAMHQSYFGAQDFNGMPGVEAPHKPYKSRKICHKVKILGDEGKDEVKGNVQSTDFLAL